MTTKEYVLEIDSLHDLDGGGTTSYYSKGHHTPAEFIAEALKEYDIAVLPGDVRQMYMRWELYLGPDGPTHCGELYKTPGRGKFPVTITERWDELP
jgi:hypothetical protein